jgi:GNAT superfamily N-acetyltransferase
MIRPAELRDASEIARLSSALGYPVEADVVQRRLERLLGSPTDAVFVAEVGAGELRGWIHGYLSQLIESEPRVEIGGLVVDTKARRQGVGRRLVERLEAWARENGVTELSVRCREDRTEAHQFYEQLGFSSTKTQKVFRKRLDTR